MSEEFKLKIFRDWLDARNAVRTAKLRAQNADLKARLLADKMRSITGNFPEVFHRHMDARFGFDLTQA